MTDKAPRSQLSVQSDQELSHWGKITYKYPGPNKCLDAFKHPIKTGC